MLENIAGESIQTEVEIQSGGWRTPTKTTRTELTLEPGEQTGWHSHDFDYVVVQLSGGRLHLDYADGSEREVDYAPGGTLTGSAPVEHNAISVGDEAIVSLEIEYKKG